MSFDVKKYSEYRKKNNASRNIPNFDEYDKYLEVRKQRQELADNRKANSFWSKDYSVQSNPAVSEKVKAIDKITSSKSSTPRLTAEQKRDKMHSVGAGGTVKSQTVDKTGILGLTTETLRKKISEKSNKNIFDSPTNFVNSQVKQANSADGNFNNIVENQTIYDNIDTDNILVDIIGKDNAFALKKSGDILKGWSAEASNDILSYAKAANDLAHNALDSKVGEFIFGENADEILPDRDFLDAAMNENKNSIAVKDKNFNKDSASDQFVNNMGSTIVQNIPNMILGAMSGGTSQTGKLASPDTMTNIYNTVMQLKSNPMFWNSFVSQFGSTYQNSLDEGADDYTAFSNALLTALPNSVIEIGGGPETLFENMETPKTLKEVAYEWAKSALEEGSEELWQNPIERGNTKAMLNTKNPWFSLSDESAVLNPTTSAKEFAMGTAGGALLGAGPIVTQIPTSVRNTTANIKDKAESKISEIKQNKYAQKGELNKFAETEYKQDTKDAAKSFAASIPAVNVPNRGDTVGTISSIDESGNVYINVLDNDGNVVSREISEVEFDNPELAKVYNYASDYNLSTANRFVRNYKENYEGRVSADDYREAFKTFYDFGTTNVYNDSKGDPDLATIIPKIQSLKADSINMPLVERASAYNAGYNLTKAKTEANLKKTRLAESIDKSNYGVVEDSDGAYKKLRKADRIQLDALGKATNTKIVIEDLDSDGQARGYYDPSDSTIHINANAKDVLVVAFSHELTHKSEILSPEEYKVYKDYVINKLRESGADVNGKTFDQRVKELRTQYENYTGRAYSDTEIYDEIVANASQEFLKDADFVKDFVKKNLSIGEKFVVACDKIIDIISKALKKLAPETFEARQLAKDLDSFKKARQLWADMVNEASKREVVKAEKNTDMKSDGVRYLINDNFYEQINKWDGETIGFSFVIGETSEALQKAGIPKKQIRMDASKIKNLLLKHNGMTIDIIKQIPELLENPVVIIDSKTDKNSKIIMGDVYDNNKKVVTVVLLMTPTSKKGNILDFYKLSSVEGRSHIKSLFTNSDGTSVPIRYVDKKRIQSWLNVNRLQLPLHNLDLDSNNIISNSNSNVNTSDNKFSLSSPVEQVGELIAVHNLSEEKLRGNFELGGMPAPSIAITKSSMGHNRFGDISIVFGANTIDPQYDSRNDVFSADGYTSRFPNVDIKFDKKELKKIADRLNESVAMLEANEFSNSTEERVIDALKGNIRARETFLKEKNIKIEPVLRTPEYKTSAHKMKSVQDFIARYDVTFDKLVHDEKLQEEYLSVINEAYGGKKNKVGKSLVDGWTNRIRQKLEKCANSSSLFNNAQIEFNLDKSIANGTAKPVEDRYSYLDGVDNAIKENSEEFTKWVSELVSPAIGKKYIRKDVDPFTRSGNRKSFGQMHDDYTLDNVIKNMKRGTNNETGNGGYVGINEVRASASKKFKTLDDIRVSSSKLQKLTDEEVKDVYLKAEETFENLKSELCKYSRYKSSNSYDGFDSIFGFGFSDEKNIAAVNIRDAFTEYSTPAKIISYLKEYYPNAPQSVFDKVIELKKTLESLPVKYFEAKPFRAVPFSEAKYAVVPNSVSEDIIKQLEKYGVPVVEYDPEIEGDRLEKLNSLEGVRFSLSEVDNNARRGYNKDKLDLDRLKVIRVPDKERWRISNALAERYHSGTELDKYQVVSIFNPSLKIDRSYLVRYYGFDNFEVVKLLNNKNIERLEEKVNEYNEIERRRADVSASGYNARSGSDQKSDDRSSVGNGRINDGKNDSGDSLYDRRGSDDRRIGTGTGTSDGGYADEILEKFSLTPEERAIIGDLDEFEEILGGDDVKDIKTGVSEMLPLIKGKKVTPEAARKIAKHFVEYTASGKYYKDEKFDELSEKLFRVFNYMSEADTVNIKEITDVVTGIASGLVKNSDTQIDLDPEMKDFKDTIRNMRIYIPEDVRRSGEFDVYGGWNEFRKRAFGKLRLVNDPVRSLRYDEVFSQLNGYMNYFKFDDSDITENSPAEVLAKLLDVYDSLKPTYINPFDDIYGMSLEESSMIIAWDILSEGFDAIHAAEIEDVKRIAKDDKKKAVTKEREKAAERLANQNKMFKQKIEDIKEKQRKKNKEKDKKTVNRLIEARAKVRERYNESNNKTKYRSRIDRNIKELNNMLLRPTDKKHIPLPLQKPLAAFLESIDTSSKRTNKDGDPTKRTLAWYKLSEAYTKIQSSPDDFDYVEIDPDLIAKFNDLTNSVENLKIDELNASQLKTLSEVVSAVKHSVTEANKLLAISQNERVQDLATRFIDNAAGVTRREIQLFSGADKLFNYSQLDSYSYFKKFGKVGEQINKALLDSLDKKITHEKEAMDYMQKALAEEGFEDISKLSGKKAEVYDFDVSGGKIRLNKSQIMSLRELVKREQARSHIFGGGVKVGSLEIKEPLKFGGKEFKINLIKLSEKLKQENAIKLTEEDVAKILQNLTPQEARLADKMQWFFNNVVNKWGNEVSRKLYGYDKFTEKNYFQIVSDKDYLNSMEGNFKADENVLKNIGFTKGTVKNANNPIMIEDIFDVYTRHVEQMAMYNAFVPTLSDLNKFINYKQKAYTVNDDGSSSVRYDGSVKNTMGRAYGQEALSYWHNLIRDINGASVTAIETSHQKSLMSRVKRASVGGNFRVVIQQPTAYVRAAAVINPKYLAKALTKKSDFEKVKKYAPIAVLKDWGYFETGIGRQMKNVFIGKKTLSDKSMELAGKADNVTWGKLWNAVELEISDTRPELKAESDEYYTACKDRFNEVIAQTQVVDSVLHRSQIMRSKDMAVQMATSFMAEPTKTYNMLRNAIVDVYSAEKGEERGKAKKKLMRVATVHALTCLATAVAQSIVDVFRDDDDEKKLQEKAGGILRDNFLDNINPLTLVPVVKDVWSIVEGYNPERMDMSGITDVLTAAKKWLKFIQNGDESGYTVFSLASQTAKALSTATGIPVGNIMRTFENAVGAVFDTAEALGADVSGERYAKMKAYWSMSKSTDKFIDLAVKARTEGNSKLMNKIRNDLISKGFKPSDIDNKIKTAASKKLQEDEVMLNLYEAYKEDNYEKVDELTEELYSRYFTEAEIKSALNSLKDKDKKEEEKDTEETDIGEYTSKDVSIWTYEDLANAYIEQNGMYGEMRDELISVNTSDDPEGAVTKALKSKLREIYRECFNKDEELRVKTFRALKRIGYSDKDIIKITAEK